ncbi:putative reverse transcriptase, RNA-dependent DNA polymerase [Tanacetum coccineum]
MKPTIRFQQPVNTASPKVKLGASHSLEATYIEFFNDEDEQNVELGNIPNSYAVPATPNTRIHQHYPLKNVIVARIKAIRLFLTYASFMGFIVYQMDVKSAFLYGTIEEEVYVCQPPGFEDPDYPDKVYKVRKDGIFISQDKYVAEILRKFNYIDVKIASTPVDLERPLVKDGDAKDVDVHLYRSMIGSLMYLTTSRPDIIYLKGKPTLGLWYSRNSPFELVAYTDSDYAGATQDRKSTTRAEYVAAASCYGQVLWIQNQLLDYGYNFMNIMIHIDNNSTICIIENPVQHSKTKHIEIRHHFIRDCNAKKLIQMVKIDTELNVVDLLTKGFDARRHQELASPEQTTSALASLKQTALGKDFSNPLMADSLPTTISFVLHCLISTARTTANGEVEIKATIDGQSKIISEASLRRHLKLEDNDRVTSIPNTEIFEQLALMGYVTNSDKLTFQKEEAGPIPHESPLYSVYSLRRDEGSMQHTELMALVTKLTDRIDVLEKDLQQTKKTYSTALTKLILKVKKLEKQDQEDADIHIRTSDDTEVLLEEETLTELVEDIGNGGKGKKEVSTANVPVSTAGAEVSTANTNVSTAAASLVYIRRSSEKKNDKGKAIMTEPEPKKKSKKQLEQERAGLEAAIRLQEQLDEEER